METYGRCVVSCNHQSDFGLLRQTRRVKRVLRDIFRFPMAEDGIVRWLPDVGAFGLLLVTVLVPSEARKNASTAAMVDSCCRRTFQYHPPNQVKLLTSGPECWRGGRIVGICAAVERSGRVNPAVAGTRVSHTSHVI